MKLLVACIMIAVPAGIVIGLIIALSFGCVVIERVEILPNVRYDVPTSRPVLDPINVELK